ncbi:MAG TPA: Hsp33 family molecular chaperone [Roseiarcus sp.]|nr:Hsp33 family molecular chaperone [Roseiarcus sp.]
MSGNARARAVSDAEQEDIVLPFAVEPLSTRGRVVRLGPAIDAILKRHAYPSTVARIVGEAAALTVLLGSSLKIDGSFQLQTQTNGPLNMLVVDFDAPSNLRALARFDAGKVAAATDAARSGDLLGEGHLAFTIDPGAGMSRYQGIIALNGQGLEEAAHQYFQRSEQIPTMVRLAVGEIVTSDAAHWRAGGLMAQFLPDSPERRRQADLDPGDAPEGAVRDFVAEDEAWTETRALVGTVEDHELIDPTLSSERLLYRLFHERGVRVFQQGALREACRCSTQRIDAMLRSFSAEDRRDMVGDDGKIGVTCEFCSTKRVFEPAEFED